MRILIFNSQAAGHNYEYLDYLINHLKQYPTTHEYVFMVHPELKNISTEIVEKINRMNNVKIVSLRNKTLKNISKRKFSAIKSILFYKLMNNAARKYNIDQVFLMEINTFQFALMLFRQNYLVSGILFRPFYRKQRVTMGDNVSYYRKLITIRLLLKNNHIKHIHLLNDYKTAVMLNTICSTKVFKMLPDPVPNIVPLKNYSIRTSYNIGSEYIILLHIGSLSERKGTINILEAFSLLPENIKQIICIIIGGKAESQSLDSSIKHTINAINETKYNSNIIYINEHISKHMMKSFFEQCDVVLVPYSNVESSSGVVGHAIASKKLLIGPDHGLLGEMLREYSVSILIGDNYPKSIASAILKAVGEYKVNYDNTKYLLQHSPSSFAKNLIQSMTA